VKKKKKSRLRTKGISQTALIQGKGFPRKRKKEKESLRGSTYASEKGEKKRKKKKKSITAKLQGG